jgi:hypothetical protein
VILEENSYFCKAKKSNEEIKNNLKKQDNLLKIKRGSKFKVHLLLCDHGCMLSVIAYYNHMPSVYCTRSAGGPGIKLTPQRMEEVFPGIKLID